MATIKARTGDDVRVFAANPAVSVLNALLREGVPIRHVCGGKALCGTCRVRVIRSAGVSPISPEEKKRLEAVGAEADERLACQLYAVGDLEIEIPAI